MPRRKKTDKFILYAHTKSGWHKGEGLLGVNGQPSDLTLRDLVDFLTEKGITDLSKVRIGSGFTTTVLK